VDVFVATVQFGHDPNEDSLERPMPGVVISRAPIQIMSSALGERRFCGKDDRKREVTTDERHRDDLG